MTRRFDGAVLVGGQSKRMGTDKATIEIDGVPMAVRVAAALSAAGAATVYTVGGLQFPGLSAVADRWPGQGPLGGILSALHAATAPSVFVAATDLVAPDPVTICETVDSLDALYSVEAAAVAVPMRDGRRQWTHACWHASALQPLGEAFAAGCRSVHEAVGAISVLEVIVTVPDRLRDANQPADLPDK